MRIGYGPRMLLLYIVLVAIVAGVIFAVLAQRRRAGSDRVVDHGRGDGGAQPWERRADALSDTKPSLHPQGRDPETQAPDTVD